MKSREVLNSIVPLCAVERTDAEGRVESVRVPGSEGKSYTVTLFRANGSATMHAACMCNDTGEECKGATYGMCYHVKIATLVAARAAGLNLAFTAGEAKLAALANLHGGAPTARILTKGGKVFAVIYQRQRKSAKKGAR